MKLIPVKMDYKLEAASVDAVSEDLQDFLKSLGAQKKNIIEARLTVEEMLLEFIDRFGGDKTFTYVKNNFLGKPYISITVDGEQFNPLERGDDEFGNWSSSLIQNSDYTPSYTFDRGRNTVTMRFSKKSLNPVLKLLIAIVAALSVSLLKFIIPDKSITFLENDIISPLCDSFLGMMSTVEIPLVFCSVTCGILGIGDSAVFGKIGRKMVLNFVAVVLLFTTFAALIFSVMFTRLVGSSETHMLLSGGMDLLLGIIPHSLIEPFTSGNTMQVVLIAVIVGISLVVLGSKVKAVSTLVNEGNRIIVYITELISRLLPAFIFVVLLNMIWSGNLHVFLNMWKPIAAFVAVLALLLSIMMIYISHREKVKIWLLMKKMLPTFLISLGTASSTAANGECTESLSKSLGVNRRFVEFGQPTGSVVFMPSLSINLLVCAIYMAHNYNVSVSAMWLVIAVVVCSFVSVATPPVPGGAVAAYTIIFTQLGIPAEAVAIAVTVDILFDFIGTAFDSSFLQLELIRQADGNNMLNHDKLRT